MVCWLAQSPLHINTLPTQCKAMKAVTQPHADPKKQRTRYDLYIKIYWEIFFPPAEILILCSGGVSVYVADTLHSACGTGIMSLHEVIFTERSVECHRWIPKEVDCNCETHAAKCQWKQQRTENKTRLMSSSFFEKKLYHLLNCITILLSLCKGHISGVYSRADESWKYHNTLESAAEMLWHLK